MMVWNASRSSAVCNVSSSTPFRLEENVSGSRVAILTSSWSVRHQNPSWASDPGHG